jgi:hypothetical protein
MQYPIQNPNGEFQNLVGYFKNNLFNVDNRVYLNPNTFPDFHKVYLKNVDTFTVAEAKRKREEDEEVEVFRVHDTDQLKNAL